MTAQPQRPDPTTTTRTDFGRDLLERCADAVDLALDAASWPECVDYLIDLADDLHARLTRKAAAS